MPSDVIDRNFATDAEREAWRQDIRDRARVARQADGLTWKAMAALVGMAEGTLSPVVGGAYAGDSDRFLVLIERWLNSRDARKVAQAQAAVAIAFQHTPTALAIVTMLEHAQFTPDMVLISGAPGIGKTMAARRYAEANPNVTLVTGEPCSDGPKAIIQDVAQALNISAYGARTRTSRDIKIRLQNTGGLLIIDEAQYYGLEGLDQIRSWHDQCGIGVAIMGNDLIPDRLGTAVRSKQFAQLSRRVGARLSRTGARKDDVEVILGAWAFGDTEVLEALRTIARKPGALGTMDKVIRMALRMARGAEEDLAFRHVDAAWKRIDATNEGPLA